MSAVATAEPARRGGRPSQREAGERRERILDTATELFLKDGYGATSIEAVVKRAGVSKRTFYHRFEDKPALFGAVVHRLIMGLRTPHAHSPMVEDSLEKTLERLAKLILSAALSPVGLALHRLIVSEAVRFPELGIIMDAEGSRRAAVTHIANLLGQEGVDNATFAAEQFLQLVIAVPQRRALGLGTPMTLAEQEQWARDAVRIFLHGAIKQD